MDLPKPSGWCNRNSPLLFQGAGLFLFFLHICFDHLNSKSYHIAAIFIQSLTAKVQITHETFVRSNFELDVLRIFSRWPSGSRTHTVAPFLCTHLIYHRVHKKSRSFMKFSLQSLHRPESPVGKKFCI